MNGNTHRHAFQRIWHWHRRAGILIAPVLLIMAVTGGIYLMEPQIEDALYRDRLYLQSPHTGAVDHSALAQRVATSYDLASIRYYQPPRSPLHSAEFQIATQQGKNLTLFVHPGEQRLLGEIDEQFRLTAVSKRIHGGLMAGIPGKVIVELVACWTFLMALSGLYLWWPRLRGLQGVLVPRISGRAALRDLHAIPGALLALWVLVIIASGLPWSLVWGGLLERGGHLVGDAGRQEIFAARPQSSPAAGRQPLDLNRVMEIAQAQDIQHAYRIDYPWGPGGSYTVFPVRRGGSAQDSAYFFIDQYSGELLREIRWGDMGPVSRMTALGVQLHEGRLFGNANQMLNLAAVIVLIALTLTGCLLWLRRRNRATARRPEAPVPRGLVIALVVSGILLPLAGLSMLAMWLYERWKLREVQPQLADS